MAAPFNGYCARPRFSIIRTDVFICFEVRLVPVEFRKLNLGVAIFKPGPFSSATGFEMQIVDLILRASSYPAIVSGGGVFLISILAP